MTEVWSGSTAHVVCAILAMATSSGLTYIDVGDGKGGAEPIGEGLNKKGGVEQEGEGLSR